MLCGDPLQLPPISRGSRPTEFAFQSPAFAAAVDYRLELTHVFRQRDPQLLELLREARYGDLSPEKLRWLTDVCARPLPDHDGIMSTVLHGTHSAKDHKNRGMLQAILQPPVVFRARDTPGTEHILKHNPLPAQLELKCGAQVALVENLTRDLRRGSRGIVIGFVEHKGDMSMAGALGAGALAARQRLQPWASDNPQLPVVYFAHGALGGIPVPAAGVRHGIGSAERRSLQQRDWPVPRGGQCDPLPKGSPT